MSKMADIESVSDQSDLQLQTRRLEALHRQLHEIDLFKDGPIHGIIYVFIVASGFSSMMFLWLFPFGISSSILTRN